MNHKFPTVDEALAIHRAMIDLFGGAAGVRDLGTLESALLRPQIGYYDSLTEEAAAMMESLAINHPFVDGNKRVSFAATDIFLGMNGYFIECDSQEAYAFFMRLFDTNTFRFGELKGWLEEHVRPLPRGRQDIDAGD